MGGKKVEVCRNEKVALLQKLLSVLLLFSISEIAHAALDVKRDLNGKKPSIDKVEEVSSWLAKECMRISPGSKAEIFEKLKESLKTCSLVRRNATNVLKWMDDKFSVNPSSAYYSPGTSELLAIRHSIGCKDLPDDADILVLRPEARIAERVPAKTKEGRSWFKPKEVDKFFEEIKVSKLKNHLVFVEKDGPKYILLLIVSPPCTQGHALMHGRDEWRRMFTDMIEVPYGSCSQRCLDRGPQKNEITMFGYRFTKNDKYCYRDNCTGPFKLHKKALNNIPGLAAYEELMESFVYKLTEEFKSLCPEHASRHRAHTADVGCSMPGSQGMFTQICCTCDYYNGGHSDDDDKRGTLSVGYWCLCGVEPGKNVSTNKALTRFLLVDYGLSLLLSDGVVLLWAAKKFNHCTVPIKEVKKGARPWVLGSAMYVKPIVIGAKMGQDRRRKARSPIDWHIKRSRTSFPLGPDDE